MRFTLDIGADGKEAAIGRFAETLLSSGAAGRVFISQYDERDEAVYGTVVSDTAGLNRPAPLAPYLCGNKGREVGIATSKGGESKMAVFLRPCEARALVELSKLNQADRESILLITTDCPGTLSLDEYKRFRKKYINIEEGIDSFYARFFNGALPDEFPVRDCCTYCESLAHSNSDIRIMFVGAPEGEIVVESGSEVGEEALKTMQIGDPADVDEGVRETFLENRIERGKELDEAWADEIRSIDDFIAMLTYCRRCYNCRAECPICYCRDCVFQTATFEAAPDDFERRADQFGVIKMPPDTLVFHLTRMNHMATSCVACGQCTDACPQGIPVGRIFSAVAREVQRVFEYRAGADPADKLPLTVFKEDELEPR